MPAEAAPKSRAKTSPAVSASGDLRDKGNYAPDPHRLLPSSVDAEQGVLCSFLLAPREVGGMCAEKTVTAETFHVPAHAGVYAVLMEMWDAGRPIDIVTLIQTLHDRNQLEACGGAAFVSQLFTFLPTAANAEYYVDILQEKYTLRSIIRTCTEYAARSYSEQDNVPGLLDEVETRIFDIAKERFRDKARGMKEHVMAAIGSIQDLYERRGGITGLATGLADFDKMTDGLHKAEMIVIAARPSMGKCLAFDSEILLADGSVATMEELFHRRQAELLTLGDDLRLRTTSPGDFIDDGIKPVFRVTTRLGRTVESTLAHPFLTVDGWKPLADLRPGVCIAAPRRLDVFGAGELPEAEVKILGYLLGDGGLTNACPRFTNVDAVLRADFTQAVESLGGLKVREEDSKGTRAMTLSVLADPEARHVARQAFALRFTAALKASGSPERRLALVLGVAPSCFPAWKAGTSVPKEDVFQRLCQVLGVSAESLAPEGYASIAKNSRNRLTARLAGWGLMGCGAHTKFIPREVFPLRRAQIALLLNRLFATDGWATVLASGQAQAGFCSVSQRLVRQVQHLLLRFGIIVSVRPRTVAYRGERRSAWQLDITDAQALRLFVSEIGIFGKEAAVARVAEALAKLSRYQTNRDLIPVEVWGRLAQAKGGCSWAAVARAAGLPDDSNIHVGKRGLSRGRLLALAAALEAPALRQLAESDVYWDEIVSIEHAGDKQVYDLTIPETHNFVANDLCVHNTALAMNIAEHIAVDQQKPVAVFSLEMSAQQLVQRLLCSRAKVNLGRVRDGFLSERDFPALTASASKLADCKMFIDDTAGISILELRAKSRRLKSQHGIEAIFIDYLQLLRSTSRAGAGQSTARNCGNLVRPEGAREGAGAADRGAGAAQS